MRSIEGGHFEEYTRLNKIKILFKVEERNCAGDDRTAQTSAITVLPRWERLGRAEVVSAGMLSTASSRPRAERSRLNSFKSVVQRVEKPTLTSIRLPDCWRAVMHGLAELFNGRTL